THARRKAHLAVPSSPMLGVTGGAASGGSGGGISGKIVKIFNGDFTGKTAGAIWDTVKSVNGAHTSITYIFRVVYGSNNKTYVGKTLGTLMTRYGPTPPTSGGMKAVFDTYVDEVEKGNNPTMEVTLYNGSHPGIIEAWCYNKLEAKPETFNLVNSLDPS
ncbi:MAG: hypothetical protein AAGJ87_06845, partial [Pseudomonadota bacterium]